MSSTIILHQFVPNFGLPNASPFCLKLETYLRMAELPYETVLDETPAKAPKKKIPYIVDAGQAIGDSNLIIEHLIKKYGDRTDAHLSPADRGISLAMRRLIDENLYWCLVYGRWIDERNWPTTRDTFFKDLPPILKQVVPVLLRKSVSKSLSGHGMGRHSLQEVYEIGCRDIQALSDFLGDKIFFFGDQPTILDATAYGTLINFIHVPIESPLKDKVMELANLVGFSDRMTQQFFPEILPNN